MNRIFTGFAAAALTSVIALASIAPASAAPLSGMSMATGSDVILAQYHKPLPPRHGRHDNHGRPHNHPGMWNGYHGYNHSRPGYRRHSDGFWYPLGAFQIRIK